MNGRLKYVVMCFQGKEITLKQLEIENELRQVVSRIVTQVELATKQGRVDINLALEDAFIPILKSVFNLPQLTNLNRRQKNYPGIDLGDDFDRVAFQVTATTSLEKIKKTVKQFVEKKFYNSFDELYILTLINKQSSYSQSSIDKIQENVFEFDVKKHIIDPGDILELVTGLRIPAQQRILKDFKIILGEVDSYIDLRESDIPSSHTLLSNLVPITYPKNVYVAELTIDEKSVKKEAIKKLNSKRKRYSKKSIVKMALLLEDISLESWAVHENKLYSFIDFENSPYESIVDLASMEVFESEEFFESGFEDDINLFKQMLFSLILEDLKKKHVAFHSKEKIFYFQPIQENEDSRSEQWIGKRKAIRNVYEKKMSKKDPTKVAHHKHLSFELSFTSISEQWYCIIVPSWYYSYNGHSKSKFHEDLLSKQKRLEFNQTVRNLVRFLAYFLKGTSNNKVGQIGFGNVLELICEDKLVTGEVLEENLEILNEEEVLNEA